MRLYQYTKNVLNIYDSKNGNNGYNNTQHHFHINTGN